jgi:hypothetical protein
MTTSALVWAQQLIQVNPYVHNWQKHQVQSPLKANEPLDDSRGGVDVKNNNQPTEPILCEQQAAIKYRTIELVQRPSLGNTISVPTDHFFKHNSSYMSITQLRESSGSDSKGHKTTQVFTLHKTHQNIQFGLLKATAPQDDWNLQKPSFFNSKQPSIAT